MNKQGKRKSFVLLDEAPTLYIPKFEVIPATARSNKVASVYMAQDIAQMVDMFGREKAEVIIANLSNQFYGKVSSVQTAKVVSEMIGKEEQLITNRSQGSSRGSKGSRNLSHNTSTSQQERALIKPQEVMQLQPGEFVGQTVEASIPYFRAQTKEIKVRQQYGITPFISSARSISMQAALQANFRQVRKEVKAVVQRCLSNNLQVNWAKIEADLPSNSGTFLAKQPLRNAMVLLATCSSRRCRPGSGILVLRSTKARAPGTAGFGETDGSFCPMVRRWRLVLVFP